MQKAESFLKQYAKKIYGFAYSKTGNTHDAEELSSEIATVFCSDKTWEKDIDRMDAYVYRICQYTWSNFLRKNKNHWRSLNNAGLDLVVSGSQVEEDYLKQEQILVLRREIQYLSNTRRRILIAYYFENKSGKEIAEKLALPAPTVRWHLQQTKLSLKERLEMTENKIYEPVALSVGHCGFVNSPVFDELRFDILTQNICMICRKKALTVEEIAQTLGVAAVYLEYRIQQLCTMDYMKKVGANKYQTAFLIRDNAFQQEEEQFRYDHALRLALPMYNMIKEHLPKLKALGGLPDANDNFLLWALLPGVISGICDTVSDEFLTVHGLSGDYPKRSDGSEHWLMAFTQFRKSFSQEDAKNSPFIDYLLNGDVLGVKTRTAGKLTSLQYDFQRFGSWRDFDSTDLLQLGQVHALIASGREPNEHEKEVIAALARKGYVSVENESTRIEIPYFTGTAVRDYLREIAPNYICRKDIFAVYNAFRKFMQDKIPSYISREERDFATCAFQPEAAMMYILYQNGYLSDPTDTEKKRLCTLVWES